jgi:hypothetical protein
MSIRPTYLGLFCDMYSYLGLFCERETKYIHIKEPYCSLMYMSKRPTYRSLLRHVFISRSLLRILGGMHNISKETWCAQKRPKHECMSQKRPIHVGLIGM